MKPIFSLVLFLSLASLSLSTTTFKAVSDEDNQCVYTLYIQTAHFIIAGTDSVIGVALAGSDGWEFQILELVSWGGLLGPDHDYFAEGKLDIFSGRGPCLSEPPCWMNLTSDGSGFLPGWFPIDVNVTTTGPNVGCAQQQFKVEQWLAPDLPPYQLYAVRDNCNRPEGGGRREAIMSHDALAMRAGA